MLIKENSMTKYPTLVKSTIYNSQIIQICKNISRGRAKNIIVKMINRLIYTGIKSTFLPTYVTVYPNFYFHSDNKMDQHACSSHSDTKGTVNKANCAAGYRGVGIL